MQCALLSNKSAVMLGFVPQPNLPKLHLNSHTSIRSKPNVNNVFLELRIHKKRFWWSNRPLKPINLVNSINPNDAKAGGLQSQGD
jgi:hypothetical protein